METLELLWWHWAILGVFLAIGELFTGTFILLGFGIGAIFTGVIDLIFHLSITFELIYFIIFSLISIYLFLKFLKNIEIDKSGQSDYAIGAVGVVIEPIKANERGRVRFNSPILGNTIWIATAKEDIEVSSKVKIINIIGQIIEVERI
jgi:membrane protein implicated in regulation of membrane protease activity